VRPFLASGCTAAATLLVDADVILPRAVWVVWTGSVRAAWVVWIGSVLDEFATVDEDAESNDLDGGTLQLVEVGNWSMLADKTFSDAHSHSAKEISCGPEAGGLCQLDFEGELLDCSEVTVIAEDDDETLDGRDRLDATLPAPTEMHSRSTVDLVSEISDTSSMSSSSLSSVDAESESS